VLIREAMIGVDGDLVLDWGLSDGVEGSGHLWTRCLA
jgi:hypothetical protein